MPDKKAVVVITEMSQYEVAEAMGISRSRVCQIEEAALVKMKKRFQAMDITKEDFFGSSRSETT